MRTIPLTKGKVAIVDECEFEHLNKWRWYFDGRYAARFSGPREKQKKVYMHRLIMGTNTSLKVDHKNQNMLDNRRANLRYATDAQNGVNASKAKNSTSRFYGVCYNKSRNNWIASISVGNKNFHIGKYRKEIDAAFARVTRAIETYGDFATNEIEALIGRSSVEELNHLASFGSKDARLSREDRVRLLFPAF